MNDFCRVYATDFSQLPTLTCRQLLDALPSPRREQIEARRSPAAQAQSTAAAALVYEGLLEGERPGGFTLHTIPACELSSCRLERAAERFPLDWTPASTGQPFPTGIPVSGGRLYMSLSHSGCWAAAALCSEPVGMDIQTPDPLPDDRLLRIASRFHPLEKTVLERMAAAERFAEFYRLWTMKESVMKLCGLGLSLPLNSFQIIRHTPEKGEAAFSDGRRAAIEIRRLHDLFLAAAMWRDR